MPSWQFESHATHEFTDSLIDNYLHLGWDNEFHTKPCQVITSIIYNYHKLSIGKWLHSSFNLFHNIELLYTYWYVIQKYSSSVNYYLGYQLLIISNSQCNIEVVTIKKYNSRWIGCRRKYPKLLSYFERPHFRLFSTLRILNDLELKLIFPGMKRAMVYLVYIFVC